MIIEISAALIALSIVILVPFAIVTLVRVQKALKSAKRDLHSLSHEAVRLMHKLEHLTSDLQSKSESLDCLFRPLKSLGKRHGETPNEVAEWVGLSFSLFEKVKSLLRHYGK